MMIFNHENTIPNVFEGMNETGNSNKLQAPPFYSNLADF